jgi:hypothetical protein
VHWITARSDAELFISVLTIAELQEGVEKTRSNDPGKATEIERCIDDVVRTFRVLPMDTPEFREWAKLMSGK